MATRSGEFEIKLHVPDDRLGAVRAAVMRGAAERTRLRARYFDTAEGDLASNRVALRLRQEGPFWVQTAKAAGGNALHRLEDDVPFEAAEGIEPVLRRHRGSDVARRLSQALGGIGRKADAKLVETWRTDVDRTARRLVAGGTVVELALDTGSIRAGRRRAGVQELELELKQGQPAAALELAQQWCEVHGLWLDTASKAARGQQVAAGRHMAAPTGFELPPLKRKTDSMQLARALVSAALDQVIGNAGEIARGQFADEHVHQMRVGLRRLRTALRELDRIEPVADARDRQALANAFRALGAHRDAAHVQPLLVAQMRADGGPALHMDAAQAAAPDPVQAVRDRELQHVLLRLLAVAVDDSRRAALNAAATRAAMRARLQALFRAIVRDAARFDALTQEQQHKLRKRFKHLRYLCEFTQSLFRADAAAAAFVGELKPVQEALGHYQDLWIASEYWKKRSQDDADALFALGWLQARRRQEAQRCAKACKRFARRARPFWGGTVRG